MLDYLSSNLRQTTSNWKTNRFQIGLIGLSNNVFYGECVQLGVTVKDEWRLVGYYLRKIGSHKKLYNKVQTDMSSIYVTIPAVAC